jgi:hypothetical protein
MDLLMDLLMDYRSLNYSSYIGRLNPPRNSRRREDARGIK